MSSEDHSKGYAKYLNKDLNTLTKCSTNEDVALLYDKWASTYDKNNIEAGHLWNPYGDMFKSLPGMASKKDMKIIDIAAGTGEIGKQLHSLGFTNLDALDVSQGMLDEAKKKNVYKKLICGPLTESQTPGIEADEYDATVLHGALCTAHIKPGAVDEMLRIVKAGGVISFSIRTDQLPHYEGKFKELEEQKKWKLIGKGTIPYFENEELPESAAFFGYQKCQ